MNYTIKKLASLAGISTRTLRYYDQIGLLKPQKVNENNYRIYDEKNVNKLQQIMFYRALGMPLKTIKQIMEDPDFSQLTALKKQREMLQAKQTEINNLLTNIDQTIQNYQGGPKMTDEEKFQAFKTQQLADNEAKYGSEIRAKYGEAVVKQSNQKFTEMTPDDFQKMQQTEAKLISDLIELKKHPNLDSNLAKEVYQLHKRWLEFSWTKYTVSAHRGLVDMYLADKRFSDYYDDKAQTPVAKLLREVVYQYTK